MNFDFSDEQKQLRDEAQRFLADRCPPRVVREVLEGRVRPYHRDLWRGIAGLGWPGTAIPERFGGVGLGHVELCVIAEELGRVVAPVPFASSVYLATEALMLAGSEAQQREWLPRLADGGRIGCFALAEGVRAPSPTSLETRLERGALSGAKLPVPDGDAADFAIVVARTGARDATLALVELKGAGVAIEPVETIDPTRSHARIVFDGAAAEPLGAAEGWATVERLLDRAAVLMAFEQIGGAEAAMLAARDYALSRHAFGRPIGSFQAVKHKLADVYMALELARSNAYYGAWALAENAPELPVAAATARVAASEAYWQASKENIQTHGGMGFTWEFDCHLHYRRAKLLALQLGSQRGWKDKLVARLEARNVASDAA